MILQKQLPSGMCNCSTSSFGPIPQQSNKCEGFCSTSNSYENLVSVKSANSFSNSFTSSPRMYLPLKILFLKHYQYLFYKIDDHLLQGVSFNYFISGT